MSERPKILALGSVDEEAIHGSCGLHATWEELGTKSLGTGKLYKELFGKQDDTFRRLDPQTRSIVLAVEATGIDQLLNEEEREAAALVTETIWGSYEVDKKYTRSLDADLPHGAIFPYTLQSTCIGDVALRHGLRGPTVCLSIEPTARGSALREAERMLSAGEVRHAVVATVDALVSVEDAGSDAEPVLRAVVAVASAGSFPQKELLPWPAPDEDPFAALARSCRSLPKR